MTYHATAQLEMEPRPAQVVSLDRRSIRGQLAATSRAVDAADQAVVREAIESVGWKRRGLLQRLTH
jgi:hypothetical protein